VTDPRQTVTPSINFVIPDRTKIDYTPPQDTGYPAHLAAADTSAAIASLGAVDFPNKLWIEPSQWKQYAADNKLSERKLWPTNFKGRFTNQDPTHECLPLDEMVGGLGGAMKPLGDLIGQKVQVQAYDKSAGGAVDVDATAILTRKVAPLVAVQLAGDRRTVRTTPDHKWMLKSGQYREASQLRPGDELMAVAGSVSVADVSPVPGVHDVGCLTVPGYHNFALPCGAFVHNCTCHCLRCCAETTYNRQHAGLKKIALSQIGIYAIANPGKWGGANVQQVLRIAMERGFIPEPVWGQEAIFKHTLHGTCGRGNADNTHGEWVTERSHPQYFSGAAETRNLFKPTETINPRSREEMACLILHGRAIGVGRRGHSIPYTFLVWEPGQKSEQPTFGYDDSYDVQRYDSWSGAQASVDGCYCIWNMTMLAET
jgi:hypothetical protein